MPKKCVVRNSPVSPYHAGQAEHRRVTGERTSGVLVEAHRDCDVGLAVFDRLGRQRDRGVRRCAAIEHPEERNPRQSELPHHGVRVGHLETAGVPALHLVPADAGVIQREADRLGTHVHRLLAGEAAEGMQADADDRDTAHEPASSETATGAKANVTISRFGSPAIPGSLRNGTSTSSIS